MKSGERIASFEAAYSRDEVVRTKQICRRKHVEHVRLDEAYGINEAA
jgi:hypothetical protein